MRRALVLVALAALALACVKLGLWQSGRWRGAQRENAALRLALAGEVLEWTPGAGLEPEAGRRVRVAGRYDPHRHLLLSGPSHGTGLGVEIVTPLRLDDGRAILVDRGWLASATANAVHPESFTRAERRSIVGVLEHLSAAARPLPWTRLEGDSVERWSALDLGADSLRARWSDASTALVLRALPDSASRGGLECAPPRDQDERTHLSYAIQWFAFATSAAAAFVWVLRRPAGRA